jgi:hypothetical protein
VSAGEDVVTTGLMALAIANPVLAAIVTVFIVLGTGWLVYKARRFMKRVLGSINTLGQPRMKDVTPPS